MLELLSAQHTRTFSLHYKNKATLARQSGHAILAVESLISSLPPKEGQILYTARVDPHLISGCEVVLDVDLPSLKLLVTSSTSSSAVFLGSMPHPHWCHCLLNWEYFLFAFEELSWPYAMWHILCPCPVPTLHMQLSVIP
jgi:hypothetical protein